MIHEVFFSFNFCTISSVFIHWKGTKLRVYVLLVSSTSSVKANITSTALQHPLLLVEALLVLWEMELIKH